MPIPRRFKYQAEMFDDKMADNALLKGHQPLNVEVKLPDVMTRPYCKRIPPGQWHAEYPQSSPMRKRSFHDVSGPVLMKRDWIQPKTGTDKKTLRPGLLQRVLWEEAVRDVVHRVTRPTVSSRMRCKDRVPPHMACYCRPDIWPKI